ncbi:MAG: hypothetical protein LBD50_03725 [Rickettsiales bacterium]|jgi:hypothetical protein|nr:hypothetical protein [Rickettsiales bacterium]
MFYSGDSKILMKYYNVKESTADFSGGYITLVRHNNFRAEFLVDNLKGAKRWMKYRDAIRVSPALHQTMIDKYIERYKHTGGEKEIYKMQMFELFRRRYSIVSALTRIGQRQRT